MTANRAPDLTEQQFAAALQAAGLALPAAEHAAVLHTARWLQGGAARVAAYLAAGEKTGGSDAPR